MLTFRKFVINLESRPDRRSGMQRQLDRVGWDAEFIKAVRPDEPGEFPSVGARGCFLSHLEVLKRGAGSNIILMEDDLNFVPRFALMWPRVVDRLPLDWSIFYPAHDGGGLLDPSIGVMRTHMIVFHGSVVARTIKELETILSRPGGHALGGPMHIDGAYSTIRAQNPDIQTYAFSALGHQRSSRSDIAATKFYDRTPRLRSIANAARRMLSD